MHRSAEYKMKLNTTTRHHTLITKEIIKNQISNSLCLLIKKIPGISPAHSSSQRG